MSDGGSDRDLMFILGTLHAIRGPVTVDEESIEQAEGRLRRYLDTDT